MVARGAWRILVEGEVRVRVVIVRQFIGQDVAQSGAVLRFAERSTPRGMLGDVVKHGRPKCSWLVVALTQSAATSPSLHRAPGGGYVPGDATYHGSGGP